MPEIENINAEESTTEESEIIINELTKDISYLQKLGRIPNVNNNIDWKELQIIFDKAANDIKDYINNSLIPDIKKGIKTGPTGSIPGSSIEEGTITPDRIVSPNVPASSANKLTNLHIAQNTLTGGTNGNIGQNAIEAFNMHTNSVETDSIVNLNVTHNKLSVNPPAVQTDNIKDGDVTGDKLSSTAYQKIIKDYKDIKSNVQILNPTSPIVELPQPTVTVPNTVSATVNVEKFAMKVHENGIYDFVYDTTSSVYTTTITSSTIQFTAETFFSLLPSDGVYIFTYHNSGTYWNTPSLEGRTFSKAQLESQLGIVYSGTPSDDDTITVSISHKYKLNAVSINPSEYGMTISILKSPYQGCGVRVTLTMNGWSKISNYSGNYGFKGKFKLSETAVESENSIPDSIEVFFSRSSCESGIFSSYCESGIESEVVEGETKYYQYGYIYSSEIPDSLTEPPEIPVGLIIPTVIIRRYIEGV